MTHNNEVKFKVCHLCEVKCQKSNVGLNFCRTREVTDQLTKKPDLFLIAFFSVFTDTFAFLRFRFFVILVRPRSLSLLTLTGFYSIVFFFYFYFRQWIDQGFVDGKREITLENFFKSLSKNRYLKKHQKKWKALLQP